MKRLILLLLVFALGLGAGLAFYVRKELRTSGNPAQGLILEIPRGLGARDVVRLLEDKNVIRNRLVAQAYIFYTGSGTGFKPASISSTVLKPFPKL